MLGDAWGRQETLGQSRAYSGAAGRPEVSEVRVALGQKLRGGTLVTHMDREAVEEIKRHFGVVAEQVRSDVRAVAEAQQDLRRQVSEIRSELVRESEETRALIRLSYGEIDRRVRGLEEVLGDLRVRVERLEAQREGQDPPGSHQPPPV